MPDVGKAANRNWYQFKHFNAGSAQDPHLAFIAGYRRAVADMTIDLFQLRGLDQLLERVLDVFEYLADEREAIRMLTREDHT